MKPLPAALSMNGTACTNAFSAAFRSCPSIPARTFLITVLRLLFAARLRNRRFRLCLMCFCADLVIGIVPLLLCGVLCPPDAREGRLRGVLQWSGAHLSRNF